MESLALSAAWEGKAVAWLLVTLRLGAMLSLSAWLRHRAVPWRLVMGALVLMGALVVMGLGWPQAPRPASALGWAWMIAGEVGLGLALGLVIQATLAIAQGMGQVAGHAMGLGFATSIDPSSGQQGIVLDRLLGLLLVMAMLAMDVHLALIDALAQTFLALPVGAAARADLSALPVAELGQRLLWTSLRLGAPVMAVSLMIQVALAVLARVAPQMNLLTLGLAIALPAGLLCLALTSQVAWSIWQDELLRLPGRLIDVAAQLRP